MFEKRRASAETMETEFSELEAEVHVLVEGSIARHAEISM